MPRLLAVLSAVALATIGCKSKHDAEAIEQPEPVAKVGSAAGSVAAAAGSGVAAAGSGAATTGSGAATTGPGAAAGSSAGTAPAGAGAAASGSSLAVVQQWGAANLHLAAADVRATPSDVSVPGIELYLLSDARPQADEESETRLVGVVGGATGKIVEGSELLLAVIANKPASKVLARVAIEAAQRNGDVLDTAATPEQRKAKVIAPATAGHTFSFWVWTHEVPRSLEHGALDLTTGTFALTPLPMAQAEAIARATATLNGVSVGRHEAAIKTLADACSDPKARDALLRALENHPRVKSRVAVAEQIHHCGAPVVDPLITAMEQDKASVVRQAAAVALGRIGDGRARAALAKAGRGEDANLAWAAKTALGKLK
ncbi:MAG TPA: HEAT repeat domain-containing protein [Kofleriaceae bacterium]|jgi:hypothetical protein|nr:HEAT repeat domain-containing protein [Kofleriaceae bacterium]